MRETGVREKERQGSKREKDKKRFRVGERKIGRETGMVERGRQELERKKNKKRQEPERERAA